MSEPHTPIAVVCDRCRASGIAGDPAFSAIPDLLAFEPVPVRAHANNWTAEHQRAFIAALAITGSANSAARSIGRYPGGADRLRKARGGRAFADAWDAALEVARDREMALIHENASDLAARRRAADARSDYCEPGPHVQRLYGDHYDPDDYLEGHAELVESMGQVREKMLYARRWYLSEIADDPARRAAWEVLVGPVDWAAAERHEPQADETPQNPDSEYPTMPSMLAPDMVLTARSGWMGDIVGGENKMEELRNDMFSEEGLRIRDEVMAEIAAEQSAEEQ